MTTTAEPPPEPPVVEPAPEADHRLTAASMMSELLREAAVLVAVFGWLDKVARNEALFAGTWPIVVLGTALTFFVTGVVIERRQHGATLRRSHR